MRVKDQILNINFNGSFKKKQDKISFGNTIELHLKFRPKISRFINSNIELKMVNRTEMVDTKQLSILIEITDLDFTSPRIW